MLLTSGGTFCHIALSANPKQSPCDPSRPQYSNSDSGMSCGMLLIHALWEHEAVTSMYYKWNGYCSMHTTHNLSKMEAMVISKHQYCLICNHYLFLKISGRISLIEVIFQILFPFTGACEQHREIFLSKGKGKYEDSPHLQYCSHRNNISKVLHTVVLL